MFGSFTLLEIRLHPPFSRGGETVIYQQTLTLTPSPSRTHESIKLRPFLFE